MRRHLARGVVTRPRHSLRPALVAMATSNNHVHILNNAHHEYMADERKEKAVSLLRGYLNKRMRVVISDGRVIDGNFLCTDKDRNLVLGNCEEYSSTRELGKHGDIFKQRYL